LNSIESKSHCNEIKKNQFSQEPLGFDLPLEHFVDADVAARFLSLSRKHILKLAIHGLIPAHPLGLGQRKTWRFLLSELCDWMLSNGNSNGAKAGTSRTISGGGSRTGGH